jgi:hypothetical protein
MCEERKTMKLNEKQKAAHDQALTKLEALENCWDPEAAHSDADVILTDFLETLGFKEIVVRYEKIDKWYA